MMPDDEPVVLPESFGPQRLVLSEGQREAANKCDDCCPVLSCDVCGPCQQHDLPHGGAQ